MVILYGGLSKNKADRIRGDIIAAVKAVVSLSILIRTPRAKAVNGYH
jgi:hypothetical protein